MDDRTGQLSFENEFSPEKLRLARCAAGLSLAELGVLLGVSRQYAHKLEINAVPNRTQLELITKALGVTEAFLSSPRRGSVELEQCHFRSLRSSTQTVKKSIASQVELFEMLLTELEKEVDFPKVGFDPFEEPITGDDVIERAAEGFRRQLSVGIGPIANITRLLESAGVLVVSLADADDRVDAFSLFNKRPLIVRNTAKENPCRQRFDLAHELGHLVMHQGIETGCRETEAQANQFASALLMPRASFGGEFPPMRGQYLNWSALGELKMRWKVSFKAIIYRAQSLNLITQDQARSGFTYLNRNGFTKREELDERIEMECPTLVQKAIDLMDHASWRLILKDSGLTDSLVTDRFMLKVPAAPLSLVK
ncbi:MULTISPECIES: XRE family transcriptional regulator [Pseudomonas]|uniref:XRE family transcriptional regulator n=1 Tax=Pseudomonas TaxID=286 RepID=UPI00057107CF|nr:MULTISPECIES: XRE family transcriptional regulator [Pseudomonas]MCK2124542.1 XRE family transcriptional regulator [Pseudomonas sp. PNPG3]QUN70420.1 ImmA/IrrE family metallo-endopeptidase [Pseudomonas sp. JS425]